MPFHLYRVMSEGNKPRWFGVRVDYEEGRWVSTCREVDANGNDLPGASLVAPKFYGVTAEQAERRMLDVLENTYEEVIPAGMGKGS